MRTRTESSVYLFEDIIMDNILEFVHRINDEFGEKRISIFIVFLAAISKTLVDYPKINRFVIGRKLYQRSNNDISFIVKQKLEEKAREDMVKIRISQVYTSVIVSNLGSIKANAPLHHLYEWGTASIFITIGKMHKKAIVNSSNEVEVKNVITIGITIDERITDGYYFAKAVAQIKEYLEYPEKLL